MFCQPWPQPRSEGTVWQWLSRMVAARQRFEKQTISLTPCIEKHWIIASRNKPPRPENLYQKQFFFKLSWVAHMFNPSIGETEADGSHWVWGLSDLHREFWHAMATHRETLSQNNVDSHSSSSQKKICFRCLCIYRANAAGHILKGCIVQETVKKR